MKFRRIVEVIREHAAKLKNKTFLEFYIEKGTDIYYKTKDLEEILNDDNLQDHPITMVSIKLKAEPSDDKDKEGIEDIVYVGFSSKAETAVQCHVAETERDWCMLLADELDTQIGRTLYSRAAPSFMASWADLIVVLSLVGTGLAVALYEIGKPSISLTARQIHAMSLDRKVETLLQHQCSGRPPGVWAFLISLMLSMILASLIGQFKPISLLMRKTSPSVFYWGDMIKMHDSLAKQISNVKWVICVGFVVSALAGILVWKLTGFGH